MGRLYEWRETGTSATKGRRRDLDAFYELLSVLEQKVGGARLLFECNGRMAWPRRGVYFFREIGEERQDRKTLRIIRVGLMP